MNLQCSMNTGPKRRGGAVQRCTGGEGAGEGWLGLAV